MPGRTMERLQGIPARGEPPGKPGALPRDLPPGSQRDRAYSNVLVPSRAPASPSGEMGLASSPEQERKGRRLRSSPIKRLPPAPSPNRERAPRSPSRGRGPFGQTREGRFGKAVFPVLPGKTRDPNGHGNGVPSRAGLLLHPGHLDSFQPARKIPVSMMQRVDVWILDFRVGRTPVTP